MQYDIVIIGAGPGGYVAAIRGAQLGKKVAIVEKDALGGVCLNWGCIPTKALLKNANLFASMKTAKKFGIKVDDFSEDWATGIKRSRDVALRMSRGVQFLMKKNNVEVIAGKASIEAPGVVQIRKDDEIQKLECKSIIIATGARSKTLPGIQFDGTRIISSKEALALPNKPESLIILGAGAIGIEFAQFFSSYGTKVSIVEALPRILPLEDEDISEALTISFKKRKIKIHTNVFANLVEAGKDSVQVELSDGTQLYAEKLLMSVGVQPNTEGLGFEALGIEINKAGIVTNENQATNIESIYAVGDCAGPPYLAHVASAEGIQAVESICGLQAEPIRYDEIAACTYSHPEIASVGMSEPKAKEAGIAVKVGKFPYRGNGKSIAIAEPDGFIKTVFKESGELIGASIIGSTASDLISELSLAIRLKANAEDIHRTIHPHPSLSEIIPEATADSLDMAIHS